MPPANRSGNRVERDQVLKRRTPSLGYYFIVTDTKETEHNYMLGLRDSIPKEFQGKLVIKVKKTKTCNLVEEALNLASINPQYGEIWIVFDRDQVPDFDEIILEALKSGINVGWTNPCIEEWFHAYFGSMPVCNDSVVCCETFSRAFNQRSNQDYQKNDKLIYQKLNQFGNESLAIRIASQKMKEHEINEKNKPSEKAPGTTVHLLIREIKSKIYEQEKNHENR